MKFAEPPVDAETRSRDDHHLSVRLWLRLLSLTNHIEGVVRQQLQSNFQTTLHGSISWRSSSAPVTA